VSRFHSITAAIVAVVVIAGCSSQATPSGSAPPKGTTFKDINVNILTFNGPQVAEPLQRRAPDFEQLTGAHINVVAVSFGTLYDKALLDASTKTNAFDAYVFDPQWLGDFTGPGYLLDLTDRVNADKDLNWPDIGPFFRDFNASYNGKVYTIPLDGDFHMVYYRKDLLAKDNIKPPATWDDYLAIAQKYQGQDLNGDSEPDYGSCIAKKKGAQSYWWIVSIAAGLLQGKGTNEGAFFDTENMDPLFDNDAFAKALEMYKSTTQFGPPDELNMDVGGTRGLFKTGRCALSMDWGDIGTLVPGRTPRTRPARRSRPAGRKSLTAVRASSCRAMRRPVPRPSTA
jgi:multiple sugar transport system substrate-binding protein